MCATDEPVEENTVDRPEAEPQKQTEGVSTQGVPTKKQKNKQQLRGKVIRSVRFTTQEQTKLPHVNPNASLCGTPGHFHGESRKRRRTNECSQEKNLPTEIRLFPSAARFFGGRSQKGGGAFSGENPRLQGLVWL